MGISWIGPGGYGDFLSVVRDTQPPYVVVGNEDKASRDVRTASPNTLVHFRVTGHDWIDNPSRATGAERVRWLLPTFLDSQAQLLSIANEWVPSGDTPAQLAALRACVECYQGAMDEANKAGIKIAVGDFSTGNPHLDKFGVMDSLRPMLEQAECDGHYLSINHYARGGDPTSDPDGDLWVRMVRDYPRLKVVMREYNAMAQETPKGDTFTLMLRNGDRAWSKYPQFMGAAVYTLMGFPDSQWKRYEFPGELDNYRRYVRSV